MAARPATDDHESPAGISEAAEYVLLNWEAIERPLLPALRRRFDLSPLQAIEALREANRKRQEARNGKVS